MRAARVGAGLVVQHFMEEDTGPRLMPHSIRSQGAHHPAPPHWGLKQQKWILPHSGDQMSQVEVWQGGFPLRLFSWAYRQLPPLVLTSVPLFMRTSVLLNYSPPSHDLTLMPSLCKDLFRKEGLITEFWGLRLHHTNFGGRVEGYNSTHNTGPCLRGWWKQDSIQPLLVYWHY